MPEPFTYAHEYEAIVIGSGLGGLTAGALLARAGKRVLVLEKNARIGGAATTYDRHERIFEVSLHETANPDIGPGPAGEVFRALDLGDEIEFVPTGAFQEIRSPMIGAPLALPSGLDALETTLRERFPSDADNISAFLRQIARSQDALRFFSERHDGQWWLGHAVDLPLDLWALIRDMRSSLSDVLERYFGRNEALKLALAGNLPYYADDPRSLWWLAYAIAQGAFFSGGGWYIRGGSSALTERLAGIIREAGGGVRVDAPAIRVLTTEDGRVRGVDYDVAGPGVTTATAPVVIANAAPHAVADMLPDSLRADFMEPYADRPLSLSLFEIQFGLTRPGRDLGITNYSTVLLPEWMESLADYAGAGEVLGSFPNDRLPPVIVVDYGQIDSGLDTGAGAPVSVTGVDRLENWQALSEEDYAARRAAWIDAITARLDAEWPGFADSVDEAHMSTARTFHQRLGTPGGAVYGFAPEVPEIGFSAPQSTPRTAVPGLFLASAWTGFGGYTGAIGGGAMAARIALRALG